MKLVLIGTTVFVFNACQGPQGPTWKEQVTQALEHYYQGEDLHRTGELEAAEKEYLTSIEISPRPFAYYRLAQIQERQGHIDEAITNLDKALKLSPGYQRAILLKKQLQVRLQGTSSVSTSSVRETAEPSSKEALQPPENQTTKPQESIPAVSSGETDAPQETGTNADPMQPEISPGKMTTPDSPTASTPNLETELTQKAQQAIDAKDWTRAQTYYETILKNHPQDANLWYNYGFACFQQQRWDLAESAFRQVVTLNPQSADGYNDLGVTLEKNNKSGEAVIAYQMAVDIGTNPDAFFNLALLKEKLGDYKTSITLYEKYLELDSKSTYAEYVRQRVEKLRRLAF